jgi:hypothetical protein
MDDRIWRLCVSRAREGMAWLDVHAPGWVEKIDLDRLDMRSMENCVLGQLYGSYFAREADAAKLRGGYAVAKERGFAYGTEVDTLTMAWIMIIVEHRVLREMAAQTA